MPADRLEPVMTLVYDDLPITKGGVHRPDSEVAAWQAAHEPILRIAVWLGPEDKVMTHVDWAPGIQQAETMCKPLPEMAKAVLAVYKTMRQLAEALAAVEEQRRVFEGAPQA